MTANDLVTVATYYNLPEAEAARLQLGAEGIEAHLTDVEIIAMDWLLANAVGGVKLQVRRSDAEIARVVLNRLQAERKRRADTPDMGDEDIRCLSCGAILAQDVSRCPSCGWSYD